MSVRGFPGVSAGKESPAMQETWVQSLGREDPLEADMATHSSVLAQKVPWTEEPDWLQFMGQQRVDPTEVTAHTQVCKFQTVTKTNDNTIYTYCSWKKALVEEKKCKTR